MLIEFNQLGKIYKIKENAFDVIEHVTENASICEKSCPKCGKDREYSDHGFYTRSLHDIVNGEIVYRKDVKISRVKCNACNATHAILAAVLVPYCVYSVFFILHVISARLIWKKTIEEICLDYDISPSTFRRFMKLYKEHREEWLVLLDQYGDQKSDEEFIREMMDVEKLFPMLERFCRKAGSCFFQSRTGRKILIWPGFSDSTPDA
jgi:transposase